MKKTITICDVCQQPVHEKQETLHLLDIGRGWFSAGQGGIPAIFDGAQRILDVCGEACLHKKIAEVITKDTRLPSNPDQPVQCQRLKPLHV